MPVIKSAKKKLKVDKKRESSNKKAKSFVDFVLKKAQKKPTAENVKEAFGAIDKCVKNNIFHKNKAARIKSGLSRLISGKTHSSTKISTPKSVKTGKTKNNKK
jgi:small subunit ribosomal protein S20